MARGSKAAYSDKQKRQAKHIEEGYEDRGVGEKESKKRAWATVNKTTGGGKKAGSGRKKTTSADKTTRKGKKTNAERKKITSAKKATPKKAK